MNSLQMQAIKKAGQIRSKLGLDLFKPVNIFDACAKFDLNVRFIPVSMEGMYVQQDGTSNSEIFLSSLRPYPRRVFTCAHELGHHLFKHGTRIDGLSNEGVKEAIYDHDEYLVDSFAGALLMPVAGIDAAFLTRKWDVKAATPLQYYMIASIFGTGYATLVTHCRVNGLINDLKATELQKYTPAKILKQVLGPLPNNSHFKIIDEAAELDVVDLETGNYLILPENAVIEGNHLSSIKSCHLGNVFVAEKPGILRATCPDGKAYFIRIQNAGYIGLAENRHLEDK